MRFALFCLGDRAYGPQFCVAGRKLAARLVQLGASPWCQVGYGDDGSPNGGVFGDLDKWLEETFLPILPQRERIQRFDIISPYSVKVVDQKGPSMFAEHYDTFRSRGCPMAAYSYLDGERVQNSIHATRIPLQGSVISNDRITDLEWNQDTRHISIQVDAISGTTGPFLAGDILSVAPSNSIEQVDKFLRVLPKSTQSLVDSPIEVSYDTLLTTAWPQLCTIRELLTHCADIQALPEREDLRVLSSLCTDSEQSTKLLSLSETSGAALYTDYILREKRTWADVLYDFDTVTMTVETLLFLLPPMRPRQFSIASAPATIVDLCVAVVEGTTPLGRSYHGLCSTYLRDLTIGERVHVWISPGSFGRLPLLPSPRQDRFKTPIVFIGAGTGIAPLRGLIQERERVRILMSDSTHCVGTTVPYEAPDNILVFGCRKERMDFYYNNEWDTLAKASKLSLYTAFSQDQWHKIYVQQIIRDTQGGTLISVHILEKNGAIFIAGSAKMARAVKDEIVECLSKVLGGTKEALEVLKTMQRNGKFAVEAWS